MHMRIVRTQVAPEQVEEVARRWAAFWPERLCIQPGFQHAHFGIDRVTGAIVGVTVFAERPDDMLFERLSRKFRAMLDTSGLDQPPESTVYEITAEV
jgi:hypothetical protein